MKLMGEDMMTEIGKIPEPNVWLKQVRKEHRKKGGSAWAVAHSWHRAKGLPDEVCNILNGTPKLIRMEPEGAVTLPGAGGAGSCDVFACIEVSGKEYVLVVEAKVDENFGDLIEDWYKTKDTDKTNENKRYRLNEMCERLGVGYDYDKYRDLRYDLFHKAYAALKSAVFWNADGAIMIVQSFCSDCKDIEEFEKFFNLFKCRYHMPMGISERFYGETVVETSVDKDTEVVPGELYKVQTPSDIPLFLGWAKCEMPEDE